MRLVTFLHNGSRRLGALHVQNDREVIVDLNRADSRLPADIVQFLRLGGSARELATNVLHAAPAPALLDRGSVALKAVIPNPEKVICIGLNYRDHAIETKAPIPEVPTVFTKYANTLIGDGEPIVIPRVTQQVDYEAELAFVIGRRGRYISEAEATHYIAGYTIFNDISARDYQMRTSQWTIGKTFDTFGPLGPALVTADEIPDPGALAIRLSINGDVLQDSNTSQLIFPIPRLVAYLSEVMTLEPGDVIATGTPSGVGFTRQPPRFLRPQETVRVEIEKVGVLENPVVAEE
jgi:2-keto-4-pentenoate hydratase/2-oxohepta-3-ene-1,7-dioic acid hydratase in catechol pathway